MGKTIREKDYIILLEYANTLLDFINKQPDVVVAKFKESRKYKKAYNAFLDSTGEMFKRDSHRLEKKNAKEKKE